MTKVFSFKVKPIIAQKMSRNVCAIERLGLDFGDGAPIVLEAPVRRIDAMQTIELIEEKMEEGWRLITWAGIYYDLSILADETRQFARLRELSWTHIDVQYHLMAVENTPLPLPLLAEAVGEKFDKKDITTALATIRQVARKGEAMDQLTCNGVYINLEDGWMDVATATEWSKQIRGYAPLPNWMRFRSQEPIAKARGLQRAKRD